MSVSNPKLLKNYTEVGLPGISFSLIQVPVGNFMMGSEEHRNERPIHEVFVDSFYIGQNLVNQRLWKTIMGEEPSYFKGPLLPVEQVNVKDIQLFLEKLNDKLKLEKAQKYRLPTEAEWEYAAQGGPFSTGTPYSGGEVIDDVAWYNGNSSNQTREVGKKAPNELGIYDMSGNIDEWCADWYGPDYYYECDKEGVAKNPFGPSSGGLKVCRGGNWSSRSLFCRVYDRNHDLPISRYRSLGFRLAKTSV